MSPTSHPVGSTDPRPSGGPGAVPLLVAHRISKAFPGVQALKDVTFDLRAGEVHALMGENGAGKSTLMKIIAGVERPDEGSLAIDGRPLDVRQPVEAIRNGVVTVFQELTVLDNLDVGRNLLLGDEPLRGRLLDHRRLYATAAQALDAFGVDLDVRTPLEQLTVGMKQIVEIVRAARLEPRVLILDEPTSSLGRHEETLLFSMIEGLRERGVGIIYISHRMDEVFQLADRITVLRDGRYVLTSDAQDVDRDGLIRAMVGREVVDDRLGRAVAGDAPVRLLVEGLHRAPRVNGVDLQLRAGEVTGLAGLVGAGRTELAEVLYGYAAADAGRILLDGRPLDPRSPRHAMRTGIGYVPEDRKAHGLVVGMAVQENLTLSTMERYKRAGLLSWAQLRAAASHWVDRLDIRVASLQQVTNTLSGGNQQKVVLAKVLSRRPEVLILDEPTRGIDVGSKREIHELIREIAADGVAVLMISSELPEILAVSDRIVVMRAGEISGELHVDAVTEEDVLQLAFADEEVA